MPEWHPAVGSRAGEALPYGSRVNLRWPAAANATGCQMLRSGAVASTPNDRGYVTDSAWLTNTDGTISYCRRVGTGDQALRDRFDGSTWSSSTSPHHDHGYPDTFA